MPNIINDIKLDFKDVLLRPRRSILKSRSEVVLEREFTFCNSKRSYKGIPIIASNMDTTGVFDVAKVLSKQGLFTAIHKNYTLEEWKAFAVQHPELLDNVAVTSGVRDENFQRLCSILDAIPEISFICLDIANGYCDLLIDYLRKVRSRFPNHTIIAGNAVTVERVEELILNGADIVKVGIGAGSVCTTRIKTAVGYPQLSAIIECADVAHALNAHIICDGGCICSGDIVKAFGAGSDFVMIGGLLAGHDETAGNLIEENGKKFKVFYGTASNTYMQKYAIGADYRASEGKTVRIPCRGPIENTILDIMGGIRSACTYVGARKLSDLPDRTTFIRCTQQFNSIYGDIVSI